MENPIQIWEWFQHLNKGDFVVIFVIACGLYAYYRLVSRRVMIDLAKRPKPNEILLKVEHENICVKRVEELKELIIDNREVFKQALSDMKENVLLKMENTLLHEIRSANNKEKK